MLSRPREPEDMSQGIAIISDPAVFLFERRPTKGLRDQKACYSQVVELMLDSQSNKAPEHWGYDAGVQLVPWRGVEHHIKVVVIYNKKDAVLKAVLQGCSNVGRQLLLMELGVEGEEDYEEVARSKRR
jgi:hypothetical protein